MSETPTIKTGPPSPILIIMLILPVLGLLAALATAVSTAPGGINAPEATPAPVTLAAPSLINRPAPNFELNALNGETISLADYRGKVVFLNFWATWCEPCKRELPAFRSFVGQQGSSGAAVIAINIGETDYQVEAYFEANNISGLTVALDSLSAVQRTYNAVRLPSTFVIDQNGVIRFMHLGEITFLELNSYVQTLGL